jgi:hypothetical protein
MAAPSRLATTMPATMPSSQLPPWRATMPDAYAPMPKKATWPKFRRPVTPACRLRLSAKSA